jgi:DNA-binding NtrC family response regulator
VAHARHNDVTAKSLTRAALSVLVEHDWPGNVRELSNVVERMVVLADGEVLGAHDARAALAPDEPSPDVEVAEGLRPARDRFERDYILGKLVEHDWRIQETAETLGINRSHLWKKMKRLGIEMPDGELT